MNLYFSFIDIISFSLWNRAFDERSLASLSDEEWNALYEVAQLQGLTAFFFDGLDKLSTKPLACRKLLQEKGAVSVIESELRWSSQFQLIQKLTKTYKQHGIQVLLLKGLGLSLCYPNPKLRESNDIDIYLFGQYEEGNCIAEQELGARVEKFDLKEDHFFIDGFSFDNHICFRWPGNEIDREFDHYLKDLLKQNELLRFPDSDILLPPPEFNLLFLLSHSYGHFMREGVALRQITDLACFLNKNAQDLDWNHINTQLQKFRLKKYADAILSFIQRYFGLSFGFPEKVDEQLLERMFREILGNSHMVAYPRTRFEKRVYFVKTAWKNRWCYDAFYDGGFRQFVLEILKKKLKWLK